MAARITRDTVCWPGVAGWVAERIDALRLELETVPAARAERVAALQGGIAELRGLLAQAEEERLAERVPAPYQ